MLRRVSGCAVSRLAMGSGSPAEDVEEEDEDEVGGGGLPFPLGRDVVLAVKGGWCGADTGGGGTSEEAGGLEGHGSGGTSET